MRVHVGLIGIGLMAASVATLIGGIRLGVCVIVFGLGLSLFVDSTRK